MVRLPPQLANKLNVSRTTVTAWIGKGCPCTRTKSGGYRFTLHEVQRWRAASLHPRAPAGPTTIAEARTRKEAALAGLRELELRKRKGELVTREAVARATFAIIRRARDQFFNLPDRLAGLLAAERDQTKIHAMLTKEIHAILTELSHGTAPPPR